MAKTWLTLPPMRCLVTGGAGFIGSSFIRLLLTGEQSYQILNMDSLTYAGNLENLSGIDALPSYRFFCGDICDPAAVSLAWDTAEAAFGGPVDAVVHFAAESHVDRSIEDPTVFLHTNILGTETLLREARLRDVQRFVHVSTDEVYGSLSEADAHFCETTPIAPNSPYAASKASSDLMARAYFVTYGLPVVITRCSNNYGPYQFPEKLIPLMITNALEDSPLPVYGDGRQIRDWVYVDDHVRGVEAALRTGMPGEIYNFGGHAEVRNIDVVRTLLELLGKPESLIRYVTDRLGHDRRYAMSTEKAGRDLDWSPRYDFANGLRATVQWYLDNPEWVARVRSGAYRDYYTRMYAHREELGGGV